MQRLPACYLQVDGVVKKMTSFEASVGARVLLEQVRELEKTPPPALEGQQAASIAIGAALGALSSTTIRPAMTRSPRFLALVPPPNAQTSRELCGAM